MGLLMATCFQNTYCLEADMIGKIRLEMNSRRRALPITLGFVAAPTDLTSSSAEAQIAGWNGERSGGAQVANSTFKRGAQVAKSGAPSSMLRRGAPKLLWRYKAADHTA